MESKDSQPTASKEIITAPRPTVELENTSIPCCPVCSGRLIEIRAKFQCSKCHRICETCCEGGRG